MIFPKSASKASAIRTTVSNDGFLKPRSTYPTICSERPDRCATEYFERPCRSRSSRSNRTICVQMATRDLLESTRKDYERNDLTAYFTVVKYRVSGMKFLRRIGPDPHAGGGRTWAARGCPDIFALDSDDFESSWIQSFMWKGLLTGREKKRWINLYSDWKIRSSFECNPIGRKRTRIC